MLLSFFYPLDGEAIRWTSLSSLLTCGLPKQYSFAKATADASAG